MPIGMTPPRRTEEERDPTKVCAVLQWYHFMLRQACRRWWRPHGGMPKRQLT